MFVGTISAGFRRRQTAEQQCNTHNTLSAKAPTASNRPTNSTEDTRSMIKNSFGAESLVFACTPKKKVKQREGKRQNAVRLLGFQVSVSVSVCRGDSSSGPSDDCAKKTSLTTTTTSQLLLLLLLLPAAPAAACAAAVHAAARCRTRTCGRGLGCCTRRRQCRRCRRRGHPAAGSCTATTGRPWGPATCAGISLSRFVRWRVCGRGGGL